MDRPIVYPGSLPQDTDILRLARSAMVSDGYIATSILGGNVLIDNLPVTSTTPASMAVNVGPGSISIYTTVDGTAYGSLPADAGALRKTGIQSGNVNIPLSAPTNAGQSIVYLIQVAYGEIDADPVTLAYYNSANPSQPLLGPAGGGVTQATTRRQIVQLQAKPGTPGSTPSAPAADNGWFPLANVTIAYGATSISTGNIAYYSNGRMAMNLQIASQEIATAITSAGIALNPSDTSQLWQAISAAASGAAKLGYVPVKTGGGHASPATTNVYLDYNPVAKLPTLQVDGVGFQGDLATSAWVGLNYQPVGTYATGPDSKYQTAIGFTPLQQGGGTLQGGNKLYIGWDGANGLVRLQVDNTDFGGIALVNKSLQLTGGTMLGDLVVPKLTATGAINCSLQINAGTEIVANKQLHANIQSNGVSLGNYRDNAGNYVLNYSVATLASEFAFGFAAIGSYWVQPNGLIIQCFGFSLPEQGYGEFPFPIAFPRGCFACVGSIGTDGSQDAYLTIQARDNGAFKARLNGPTNGGSNGCSGIAIGW